MYVRPTSASLSCDHIHHIFENPFCERLPLFRRVAIIAFHILTLCIPLLLYHVITCFSCCFPPLVVHSNILSVDRIQEGTNSIHVVMDLVRSVQKRSSSWLRRILYPPIDRYFFDIVNVYWDNIFEDFKQALKAHPEDPWSQKAVLDAANLLMQAGYTISMCILQDFPKYVRAVKLQGYPEGKDVCDRILSDPQCYASFMLHYCSQVYTWLQAGVVWDEESQSLRIPDSLYSVDHKPGLVSINSDKKFHNQTLVQYQWRLLYNDFCKNASHVLGKATKHTWLPKQDLNIKKPLIVQESLLKSRHVGRDQKLLLAPYGRLGELIERTSIDSGKEDDLWLQGFLTEERNSLDFAYNIMEDDIVKGKLLCKQLLISNPNKEDGLYYKNNVDYEIRALYGIYRKYEDSLKKLINQHTSQAWRNKDVLEKADELLKIVYTLGVLMLEDIPIFCDLYRFSDYEEALLDDASCLGETLLLFPNLYRHYRRGVTYSKGSSLFKESEKKYSDSEEHKELFFLDKGLHRTWQNLYNQYCNRLKMRLSSGKLKTKNKALLDYLILDSDKDVSFQDEFCFLSLKKE